MKLVLSFLALLLLFPQGSLALRGSKDRTSGAEAADAGDDHEALIRRLSSGDAIPGSYIVRFRDEAQDVPGLIQALTVANQGLGPPSHVYESSIKGFATRGLSVALARQLADSESVISIEPDRVVSIDDAPPTGNGPPPGKGPSPGNGGGDPQQTPYGVTRVGGGATYTGSNVAFVLDTGVDIDHPDLIVDSSRGFNAFINGKDGQDLDDGNGHGTHVAGTIAAIDNTIGVIGVAAGATIVPVKVLGSRGSGSYSGVIAGIDHVAANGKPGDVANMSLGGPFDQALNDAVIAAASTGVLFVVAAGNEADDAIDVSPASADHPNIYTISAMDQNDNFASYSNYGYPTVNYCAPGTNVRSTWKNGGYNTISGTSMATPNAAGVLLLTAGAPSTCGTVIGDPDGVSDPIICVAP